MTLQPGFNIVTKSKAEYEKYSVLEFLRSVSRGKEIPNSLSVVGLEKLLVYADEENRESIIEILRDLMRESDSLKGMATVQFLFDGNLVSEDRLKLRIEEGGEIDVLDIGELFVATPELLSPTHAYAEK